MLARRLIAVWGALLAIGFSGSALAAQTQVAVAANFTEPAKAIAAAFTSATGHKANLSFGSSGQFFTQINQGAPFEVFLSADTERPLRAEQQGLGVAGTRFTYAVGRLVLYSKAPDLATPETLRSGKFEKLSIADPRSAPYGQAAIETLQKMKLHDAVKSKIVTGSSITQAYQFVATGAAELGFVALSQVIEARTGSKWVVPANLHTPIDQQAILLATGRDSEAARAFLAFLKGPKAKAIIRRYGYEAN